MSIDKNVILGAGVLIHHPDQVNLYGCRIGDDTRIGSFVEIQKGCSVGARCKISSHSFLCEGVHIEDEVFVGHGVMFCNDLFPSAVNKDGTIQGEDDWACVSTQVESRVSIGSNATILCGVTIGKGSIVGAGAMVTRNVEPMSIVAGVPARHLRFKDE